MFNKKVKVVALITALVFALSLMAGCGSSSTESSNKTSTETAAKTSDTATATTKSEGDVTVGFMTWESQAMNEKILNSFKQFEKDNPGIKVTLVPSPLKDYGTKLKQMLAANEAPEIFQTGNDWALQYGAQGQLFDYTQLAGKEAGFLDKFYPGVIDNWKVDGKLYGVPGLLNCYGVFYNKKLFKEANIPEPKIGWTYMDMLDAAKKLAKKDGNVQTYGLYYPPYAGFDPFFMSVYSVSAGGAPFADGIVKVTKAEASAQFKEGVKLVSEGIKGGYIQPPTFNADNLVTMFMQDKVPMMQHGQWNADELIRNAPKTLEWGFAPNPTVTKQSTIYDCVGYSSPAKIKNPEAVFKVLKYMDTKTYEIVLPETPVAPSAYAESAVPYYNKLKETGHGDVAEALDYMLKSPDKQPVRFQQTWAGDAKKFIDAEWNNIISGKSPEAKVDELVKNINDVIGRSK